MRSFIFFFKHSPGVVSYPLLGQFRHFFLQFVQDVKVWLVLSGVLLELNHTLVRILLKVIKLLNMRF